MLDVYVPYVCPVIPALSPGRTLTMNIERKKKDPRVMKLHKLKETYQLLFMGDK